MHKILLILMSLFSLSSMANQLTSVNKEPGSCLKINVDTLNFEYHFSPSESDLSIIPTLIFDNGINTFIKADKKWTAIYSLNSKSEGSVVDKDIRCGFIVIKGIHKGIAVEIDLKIGYLWKGGDK